MITKEDISIGLGISFGIFAVLICSLITLDYIKESPIYLISGLAAYGIVITCLTIIDTLKLNNQKEVKLW